jgi:hypothetical protein
MGFAFPSSPCSNRSGRRVKSFRNVYSRPTGSLIQPGNSGPVPPFETLRPAPPVPPPGGSLAVWVWLVIGMLVVVAAGVILASRH